MIELAGYVLVAMGGVGDLFGAIALMRYRDNAARLRGSVACVTFGTCSILAGVVLCNGLTATGVKALLCAVFVLAAFPVLAHAIARAVSVAGNRSAQGIGQEGTGEPRGSI